MNFLYPSFTGWCLLVWYCNVGDPDRWRAICQHAIRCYNRSGFNWLMKLVFPSVFQITFSSSFLFFLTLCLIWIRVCMCYFLFSLIFENGLLLRLKSKFKTVLQGLNQSITHAQIWFLSWKLIMLENKLCVSLCHICSRWFNTSACHCFMFFLSDFRQGSNHCELWMKAEL